MIRLNDLKRETEVSKVHPDLLYMKRPYRLSLLGLFRPKLHVYAVPSKEERAKTSAGEYGVMIGTVVCPFMLTSVGDESTEHRVKILMLGSKPCARSSSSRRHLAETWESSSHFRYLRRMYLLQCFDL